MVAEIWVLNKKNNGGFWVFMEKKIRRMRNRSVALQQSHEQFFFFTCHLLTCQLVYEKKRYVSLVKIKGTMNL